MKKRHSWGLPHRFPHKTERQCVNGCGIVKVSRHEADQHWVEYWLEGERIECVRTPACEPVRADA